MPSAATTATLSRLEALATAHYEAMSPTLLAQQQPIEPVNAQREASMWSRMYEHLESRLQMLRAWRYAFWAHWALLAALFCPRRYIWLVVPNRMWSGNPINDAIKDTSPLDAVNTCASGMWSGITNPAREWFKLGVPALWQDQIDGDGKAWLEDTQEKTYTVLAQSNFYGAMAQGFEDETVFGTAPILIYEDFEDAIRLYNPCAGEYYLGNGARFTTDQFYREFVYTVTQIVEAFGIKNCPYEIQQEYRDAGGLLNKEYVVCHAIEPNTGMAAKGSAGMAAKGSGNTGDGVFWYLPKVFTWREVYWLRGMSTMQPLSKRGFFSKPFMVLRWKLQRNDAYGRSPCMDALGDNKQIQMETLEKGEFIKKLTKPPMGANPALKNEPNSVNPGSVTYTSIEGANKGFWPLFEVKPEALKSLIDDIGLVAGRIAKALFVDVFMAISQMAGVQPRNELELTKRDLERLQKLGPVLDLNENELKIGIHRVIDIMKRRRMIGPKPPSLANIPLEITFVTLMRIAQRSATAVAMKDTFATMGELSTAAKAAGVPDPIRVFNLDKSGREFADLSNYPASCIFSEAEVAEHDQARAKAAQQAAAPQQMAAAVDAAKSLSQTQIGGGNALGALLGRGGAGGGLAAGAGP